MSEYSGCEDFEPLLESYKKAKKLKKFLNTPKMRNYIKKR